MFYFTRNHNHGFRVLDLLSTFYTMGLCNEYDDFESLAKGYKAFSLRALGLLQA